MQALLKAQINKTDRNDARGMAQMMRVGLYRPVHTEDIAEVSMPPRLPPIHLKTLQDHLPACCKSLASFNQDMAMRTGRFRQSA